MKDLTDMAKKSDRREEWTQVDDSNRGAYRGGGSLLEWRLVRKVGSAGYESGEKIVGQEFSHGSRNTTGNV